MTRVGAWSPVVGLAVYVLGTCLAFCAPVSAWPALAIVVYVGWGIQLLTDGPAGPYASTFWRPQWPSWWRPGFIPDSGRHRC